MSLFFMQSTGVEKYVQRKLIYQLIAWQLVARQRGIVCVTMVKRRDFTAFYQWFISCTSSDLCSFIAQLPSLIFVTVEVG